MANTKRFTQIPENTSPDTTDYVIGHDSQSGVDQKFTLDKIAGLIGKSDYVQFAANPDCIITGAITRDANEAALSAAVTWPDGSGGTYTADTLSTAFPGAVDAYHITYTGSPARTYTQPLVTRDAAGAVITRPAMVVT